MSTTTKANSSANKPGFAAVFSSSFVARTGAVFALVAVLLNSASLAEAAIENTANMQVSATVIASCDVHMLGGASSFASPSTFDVTCAAAPHAAIEKDPTIHIAEDGRPYVITTVQF
jgi:hypothetical protein